MQSRSGGKLPQVRAMTQAALFTALIVMMAYIPFLGYIPLGPIRATTIHIPVIIGALVLGPKKGAFLGFVFGLTSFLTNTFTPTATSFVFTPFYSLGELHGGWQSLIVCFLPRILIGVAACYVFRLAWKLLCRAKLGLTLSLGLAGLAGALTNTLLVMNGIYVFFKAPYAQAKGFAVEELYNKVILTVIGTNGLAEAAVSAVLTALICRVLIKANVMHMPGADNGKEIQ